jgi:flagellar hook-basal body complex protein FliE
MRPTRISGHRIEPLRDTGQQEVQKAGGDGADFKEMLEDYMSEVDSLQDRADKALQEVATGRVDNLHRLVVATSEAELSFRLMMQTRNKLVDAYKEIMRMKV